MSEPQASQPAPEATPAPQPLSAEIQPPPPAYAKEPPATTMDGSRPAPATEMPTSPSQPEQQQHTTTPAGQKSAPAPAPALATVTPLHMLGDEPAFIDCPFCQTRAMTNISKDGSGMQMVAGALCCLLCVCLTCVPCIAGWFEDTNYTCANCRKTVATRPYDGPIRVFGPQPYGAVPSQYQSPPPPVAEKQQAAQA
ncbi:Putative LITAF domain containing protein [Colletotrichum destructivum]|uniref:LITAF domain containing protein n=1 Tax=Colletotrichum destructivum TaxID=34406 RepID=A0AAX4I5B9_9PEZI|nr:Putative LITAF domain containing protein [Colletotrichum destructivum]